MPITVNHVFNNTIADWVGAVTVGNSTGGTTTAQGTDLVQPSDWNSAHNYTLGLTASEIASIFNFGSGLTSASGPVGAISVGIQGMQYFEPFPIANSNTIAGTVGMGTWYFSPFNLPFGISGGRFNVFNVRDAAIFLNGVSGNSTSKGGFSATAVFRNCLALYTQGTGANVTRLESIWTGEAAWSATRSMSMAGATSGMTISNYLTIGFLTQINTAGASTSTTQTGSGTFSTGTTSVAATKADSLITVPQNWFTGSVMDIIPMATALTPGNYWMGMMHTTNSGGGGTTSVNYTTAQTYFNGSNTRLGHLDMQLSAYKRMGQATSANSSSQGYPFHGTLNTTTSNATVNFASSDMQNFTHRYYWNYVQDTL